MSEVPAGSGQAPGWGIGRLSLRWRLMLIGIAGLSAGLLLGGWLLLAALGLAFDRSVDASARRTASDVAALIAAGPLPQPVPVVGVQFVQVLDAQHRVRAGSPGADRLVPLLEPAELARALSGQHLEIDGSRAGLAGQLRVSAIAAGPAPDRLAVVVAAPTDDAGRAVDALRLALLGLFLPLVTVLAAIAWWVIGRTLRPVEALRAGAEGITDEQDAPAGEYLPVPSGDDEIHRLAVTLNGMLGRLAAGRRRQQQFVADAAHELRNPLAGMRTHLEVAQRHPAETDWQELTEDLLADTGRLAGLAEDLLLLAGSDEAVARPRREPPEFSIRESLTMLADRYRDVRVQVVADALSELDGELVLPDWSAEDFHRLITNLLDNAVRHARSAVWLTAGRRNGQLWITVTDDGPGIAVADRERVFGRFVRLDEARSSDDGGAGLGLAIVAELLRRHSGSIRLGDAGPGLTAELLLPAGMTDQTGPAGPAAIGGAQPGATA